ncbi:MAG: hypothetical protein IPM91_14680 [Bacteroidetes bacterium]|nr:hypothetical protein [Bacteroidota bacterium]
MKVLLVKSNSQTEMKFISDLLKKLGVSTRILNAEDIEDYPYPYFNVGLTEKTIFNGPE